MRIGTACSIGGSAVDAAPHSTIAAMPISAVSTPGLSRNARADSTAKAIASAVRHPTADACGRRSIGRAITPIEIRPAIPNAASSKARFGPRTPTTSRMITTMNVYAMKWPVTPIAVSTLSVTSRPGARRFGQDSHSGRAYGNGRE